MNTKILTIVLSLSILIFVLDLIRQEKLTFKYACAWMFACVVAIIGAIFHELIFKMAYFFGFELPSNFIFFTLLCGFVFLSLLLTIFLSQQNHRNDGLAQKLGLLEFDIEELKKKLSQETKKS